ncbi:MAG: BON domain-containing protein [Phycisphaerales bacterium]|jgi:osmotically-inducible protein OsmY
MPTTIAMNMKSDTQLQQDVLRELKWDPHVRETEVGVQVRDGVVTLTGQVDSYAKKIAAAEASHRVAGVLDVANDLVVKLPGYGPKSDAEIAESVRQALRYDAFVPEQSIRSTVATGIVTLEGSVSTWSQREDAGSVVSRLAGVGGVVNRISVEGPSADPSSVRTAIESALDRRAEREAKKIGVALKDGAVTLSGTVRSWGERRAVERAAGFAPGVKRVESRLVIDPYS